MRRPDPCASVRDARDREALSIMITTDPGDLIADRIRVEHRALAARWFERLVDLLPVDARDVFPTESLLDHIPALIVEISGYVRHPEDGAIVANTAIIDKARELGALRHAQKASLHQVLREYQILHGVLITFVVEEIERHGLAPSAAETVLLVSRLNQAVNVLSQSTVEAFVTLYTQTISAQADRLEQFTRMAAHEWRQPLAALQFAVSLLRRANLDPQLAERTLATIDRNVHHLVDLTHKLETIARMQEPGDRPEMQEVSVTTIAQETARQLREMVDARDVDIQIAEDMPTLRVDVGRLELVLVNLLSNAIKYSDPSKPRRRVIVTADTNDDGWCRITISDDGVGIPEEALSTIFRRFTRAHTERDDLSHVAGIGLGLAIVDECVRSMGGRIEVHSVEHEGTTFVVMLPASPGAMATPDGSVD
jgi:signal transduction histidine kinase